MEVTQESIESVGTNKEVGNGISSVSDKSSIPSQPPITDIKVKVDLTKKPAELNEPVTLMNDDDFFDGKTDKTEGDIKQEQKQKEKADAFKNTINNNPTPSSEKKIVSPDKRQAQAEKWTAAIDMVRIWGLKQWSGQADNVGLIVLEADKKQFAEALADVMEESNFDPAPLLTLAVTAVGVFGGSFTNAAESRKKIRAFRKTEAYKKAEEERLAKKEKPDLDPITGTHRKKRGGQAKA